MIRKEGRRQISGHKVKGVYSREKRGTPREILSNAPDDLAISLINLSVLTV
jgi:hypothetical protein